MTIWSRSTLEVGRYVCGMVEIGDAMHFYIKKLNLFFFSIENELHFDKNRFFGGWCLTYAVVDSC